MRALSYFLARETTGPWPQLVDGPHDTPSGIDGSIRMHARKGDGGPWIVLVGFDPADVPRVDERHVSELIHPLPEPLS